MLAKRKRKYEHVLNAYTQYPWATWAEFSAVSAWVDPRGEPQAANAAQQALSRIAVWHCRGRLPFAIEATAMLLAAQIQDECGHSSTLDKRMGYSMAVVRFVAGILDPLQQKRHAVSMFALARQVDLPDVLVDLRHWIAHEADLPDLETLREGCRASIAFLWGHFWQLNTGKAMESLQSSSSDGEQDGSENDGGQEDEETDEKGSKHSRYESKDDFVDAVRAMITQWKRLQKLGAFGVGSHTGYARVSVGVFSKLDLIAAGQAGREAIAHVVLEEFMSKKDSSDRKAMLFSFLSGVCAKSNGPRALHAVLDEMVRSARASGSGHVLRWLEVILTDHEARRPSSSSSTALFELELNTWRTTRMLDHLDAAIEASEHNSDAASAARASELAGKLFPLRPQGDMEERANDNPQTQNSLSALESELLAMENRAADRQTQIMPVESEVESAINGPSAFTIQGSVQTTAEETSTIRAELERFATDDGWSIYTGNALDHIPIGTYIV